MGGPALFSDGIWRLFKPDYPTGAEKCRCLVLLNDRGALPTLLAMLLVQSRVQGEGEAKLPSFLTYRLILVIPATNREDKAVYTEAQPSQLKSQKYRPILSHLILLRIAQVFDIYERAETNQAEIHEAIKSASEMSPLEQMFSRFGAQAPVSLSKPKQYPESRICNMHWMSLKLQDIKLAACLCLLMSFSDLSRASSSYHGLVGFCPPMRRLSFQH